MPTGVYKRHPRKSLEERFWSKVQKTKSCWIWTASIVWGGYGEIGIGKKNEGKIRAHRLSWIIHFGAIPNKLWVLHKCDNPICVRPDHLFLGTNSDNQKDSLRKGRKRNGNEIKTHCPRGHPYSGENLYVFPSGKGRSCRICRYLASKKSWEKRHA